VRDAPGGHARGYGTESAQAVLSQFAALGYIAPTDDQKKAVESCLREAKYNLARVHMDNGQPRLALPLFEELYKEQPEQARFAQHLARCYFSLRQIDAAKRVLTELMNRPPASPKEDASAPTLPGAPKTTDQKQATRDNPAAAPSAPISPALPPANRPQTRDEGQRATDDGQATIDNPQSLIENPRRPWADWLMGVIQFEEGKTEEALESLLRAQHSDPHMPDLHLRIGQTYLRLNRLDDAERAFRETLDIDGDSPEAHLGLARVMLRKRQNEQAVEEALVAVSLQHFLRMGHFSLGVALARLGHFHRATLAFETAVTMAPGFFNAHRWLIALNGRPGGDLEEATKHRKLIQALIERRRATTKP
jgi:tetratricopeptide (TPR) repeat protein